MERCSGKSLVNLNLVVFGAWKGGSLDTWSWSLNMVVLSSLSEDNEVQLGCVRAMILSKIPCLKVRCHIDREIKYINSRVSPTDNSVILQVFWEKLRREAR
ncbi:hypothetical protein L1887_03447 [Cichorium endivia]|nr:hypothetical protein L1887_03447 [Cichorium endivia]